MREHADYPTPERTAPQYRWPSEAHLCPRTCWNCGANLLYGDVPTERGGETEVSCWSCSRLQCELTSDLTPRRLTPEQFRALSPNQGHRGRPPSVTGTIATRIVRMLEDGGPMTGEMLSESLDISIGQARNGVGDARKRGHAITCSDGAYRLEATR